MKRGACVWLAVVLAMVVPTAWARDGDHRGDGDGAASSFEFGGAVRFNYGWLDDGPRIGFEPELARIDARGNTGPAFFSRQYRWYDGFDAVHHACAGWTLGNGSDGATSDLRAGIQQVPFGLLPTASHSFWFGSGYDLGIEDDDLGVVWQRRSGAHQGHAGVFSGDEYGTGANDDRYSFDVATTEDLPGRERERAIVRCEHARAARGWDVALGATAFASRIENHVDGRRHDHGGGAVHGPWVRSRYANPGPRVAASAFLFPFEIAAEADVPSFNVAWELQRTGWFDSITCYNNASATLPVGPDPGLRDSIQNVTGCSFGKGVMLATSTGSPAATCGSPAVPASGSASRGGDGWRSRFNINIGFYF